MIATGIELSLLIRMALFLSRDLNRNRINEINEIFNFGVFEKFQCEGASRALVKSLQGLSGKFKNFQELSRVFSSTQELSRTYRNPQDYSRPFRNFQRYSRHVQNIQELSLLRATRTFKAFHERSKTFKFQNCNLSSLSPRINYEVLETCRRFEMITRKRKFTQQSSECFGP